MRIGQTSLFTAIIWLCCFSAIAQDIKAGEKMYSDAERKQANTAADLEYLSQKEKECFYYLNLMRLDPERFAKAFLQDYDGRPDYVKGYAFDERKASLIVDLKKTNPMPLFTPQKQLFLSALCLALEQGKTGRTGHHRTKTCRAKFDAECCDYGAGDAIYAILELLIDAGEGNGELGHRRILMDSTLQRMGVAMRDHKEFEQVTVIDFNWKKDNTKKTSEKPSKKAPSEAFKIPTTTKEIEKILKGSEDENDE